MQRFPLLLLRPLAQLTRESLIAVFHLVTAADGAAAFYGTASNAARRESESEARKVDCQTQSAWLGHPRHQIFDNSGDFDHKISKVISSVSNLLGMPDLGERSTVKFKIDRVDGKSWDDLCRENGCDCECFKIEKVYLYASGGGSRGKSSSPVPPPLSPAPVSPRSRATDKPGSPRGDPKATVTSEYAFVRKRVSSSGVCSYGQTIATCFSSGQVVEVKRIITSREYLNAIKNRDLTRHVVRQKRVAFIHQSQAFNVHEYLQPVSDVNILHCQARDGDEVKVPDWIPGAVRIHEETDKSLGAYAISKKRL